MLYFHMCVEVVSDNVYIALLIGGVWWVILLSGGLYVRLPVRGESLGGLDRWGNITQNRAIDIVNGDSALKGRYRLYGATEAAAAIGLSCLALLTFFLLSIIWHLR